MGLSPRVRGHRPPPRPAGCNPGSIPACAGPPLRPHDLRHTWMVYPRVCGATTMRARMPSKVGGLSPRVRGHHERGARGATLIGSIPACAGPPGIAFFP